MEIFKKKRTNKQHKTFSHTLSQLNLTIPSWKIPQSNPLSAHSLSLFWLVTIVNVWCGCHYLQHWLWDLTSDSWSLLNNGFDCMPAQPASTTTPQCLRVSVLPGALLQALCQGIFQTPPALFLVPRLPICTTSAQFWAAFPRLWASPCPVYPR